MKNHCSTCTCINIIKMPRKEYDNAYRNADIILRRDPNQYDHGHIGTKAFNVRDSICWVKKEDRWYMVKQFGE